MRGEGSGNLRRGLTFNPLLTLKFNSLQVTRTVRSGAAAGIWTRVRGLGGLRRGRVFVSVLDQVAHRASTVLDHGIVEALALTHPWSGPFGRVLQVASRVIKQYGARIFVTLPRIVSTTRERLGFESILPVRSPAWSMNLSSWCTVDEALYVAYANEEWRQFSGLP